MQVYANSPIVFVILRVYSVRPTLSLFEILPLSNEDYLAILHL